LALPRFAIAQPDQRPALTIAVRKISNSDTLETPREQSNVGYRLSPRFSEALIDFHWTGDLSRVPGLATNWRRIDDRTVEFDLREGVRFHNGETLTAEVEDPAYLILHQAATVTAKRKDIGWKASKAWALDLRAGNPRFGV
jgi:ABC-type transport system substrate-binding protein